MAYLEPTCSGVFKPFQGHLLFHLNECRSFFLRRLTYRSKGRRHYHETLVAQGSFFYPGQAAGTVAHLDPITQIDHLLQRKVAAGHIYFFCLERGSVVKNGCTICYRDIICRISDTRCRQHGDEKNEDSLNSFPEFG